MIYAGEHVAMMDGLKRFIADEIDPHIEEWEEAGIFPAHDLFRKLGKLGYLGVNKPTEYGGLGLDYTYQVAVNEAMGFIRAGGVSMGISVQTDMSTPALARYGSDELKREFLVPAISGEVVTSIGVSEAGAGSDVASIRTSARKDGGDYVINGGKLWITNGTQADWICLLCNTGEGAVHKNKSLIIVPMKTKGVSIARKIRKIGLHSSDTAQIHFDDVRVPRRYLIGQEGHGFMYQMQQFQEERLGAAARRCSMGWIIDETIEYTRNRKAFGKSILDNQVVHFRLAELKTEIEALRSLVYRAALLYVRGEDVTELASMAKLKAGRLSREVADSCLQYWGGMGYTYENNVSRAYRDVRLGSIGGGADEIMLSIICKHMGILPKG